MGWKLKFQVYIFLYVISLGLKFAAPMSGQSAGIYELRKGNFLVKFTNWGASTVSLIVPDKTGKWADIVLGFDAAGEYKNNTPNLGAIVGRVANRIKGAQFTLNGTAYKLIANEGKNTLHGGKIGFSHVFWKVTNYQKSCENPSITFSYLSPDGDQGFPGDLLAKVTYKITGSTELRVVMSAKALKMATPVNLAQHIYWNLGGHDSGTILLNKVKILATQYTPVDSALIPTGKLKSVVGTPFDFIESQTVGSRIKKLPTGYDINYVIDSSISTSKLKTAAVVNDEKLPTEYDINYVIDSFISTSKLKTAAVVNDEKLPTEYDINNVIDSSTRELKIAAVVIDEKSGRVMQLRTNAVGMQFYTANFLKDVKGKGGIVYQPHAALCLKTQGFPDAVNQPNFPSQIVVPGKPYKHVMIYKFSTV